MSKEDITLPDIAEFISKIELTLKEQKDWKNTQKDLKINFNDLKSFLNINEKPAKNSKVIKSRESTKTKESSSLKEKISKKARSKQKSKSDKSDEDLEDVLEDSEDDDTSDSKLKDREKIILESIDYSALERDFLIEQQLYSNNDQGYLASIISSASNPYAKDEDSAAEAYAMSNSNTMDESEAHDTISRIMADATTGSYSEVSHKDKERLSNFANFNPALSKLYQTTSITPTGDVNFKYI